MSAWTTNAGLTVQQAEVLTGAYAARGTSSNGTTSAVKTLSTAQTQLYYRVRFKLVSAAPQGVYLQRYRTAGNSSQIGVMVSSAGKLAYRNDVSGVTTTTTTAVTVGAWHEIQIHVVVNGTSGLAEVWYDGAQVSSKAENFGTTGIGKVQLGDNATGKTYDVAFDDVAVSSSFIPGWISGPPPTATSVPPTSTPAVTRTPTDTPGPTRTATPNPTATSATTPTPTRTNTPAATRTPTPVSGGSAVVLAAGDIASCSSSGDESTAELVKGQSGDVLTLGDNAYESGSASEYANCYDPTWGQFKSRTHPAPGNHEYNTSGATGYYGYFGSAAGSPSKGYYSYDLGSWHVIVLNSNCSAIGGCGAGSAQEQWLRADLAAHPTACTLAYWHHPLFSSGTHGNNTSVKPLYQALYDGNADLVLVGHDHDYERFGPQDASGNSDPNRGIREIVVGTGGRGHYAVSTIKANSEVRNNDTFGVLKLVLDPTSYSWEFLPVAGKTFTDSGTTKCHDGSGPIAQIAGPDGTTSALIVWANGYAGVADRPRGFGNA
jgi:hypothetical protein